MFNKCKKLTSRHSIKKTEMKSSCSRFCKLILLFPEMENFIICLLSPTANQNTSPGSAVSLLLKIRTL